MRKMTAGYWLGMVACCAAAGLLASPAARAQDNATSADKWQFEFTPYLFASGIKGTVGVNGVDSEVDMGFNDIWNHLDKSFMGLFVASKGRWSLMLDGLYVKLADQQSKSWTGPAGLNSATADLDATMTEQIYQPTFGYRLLDGHTKVDVLAAGRYTQIDSRLHASVSIAGVPFNNNTTIEGSKSWWDPVVGARVLAPFAERWALAGYGDVGVGKNPTYQALVGVNWQFSQRFSAKFGYRYLKQDYESGGFKWDVKMQGVYGGLGIRF